VKNGLKKSDENLHIVGDIIETVRVGMLTAMGQDSAPLTKPLFAQEIDEQGQIWFFTSTSSVLLQQTRIHPEVYLTFADSNKHKYLAIVGTASEVTDQKKMEELWDPSLKTWFKEGLETPGIVLLKVQVQDAEYWDSPHSAVVRIAGFMKAMVSDQKFNPDLHGRGLHGRVDLRSAKTRENAPVPGGKAAP
jgi:general stress protein 26